MRARTATFLGLALLCGATTGLAIAENAPGPMVVIDNYTYQAASIEIAAGTTVTWTNHDDTPHTVTAEDRTWHSDALNTGDSFNRIFTAPGTYSYFCTLHPRMVGRIVVK